MQIANEIAKMRAQFGSFTNVDVIYEAIKDSVLRCGSLFIDLNLGGGQFADLDSELVNHIAKNGLAITINGKTYEACACGNGGAIDPNKENICKCNCALGYRGERCLDTFECPQDCGSPNNGTRVGSVFDKNCGCKCNAGYNADYCKPAPKPCSHVCKNGGVKVGTVKAGNCGCSCPVGFAGKFCEWSFPCPDYWTIFNGTSKKCDIQSCSQIKLDNTDKTCNVNRPEGSVQGKCGGCCPSGCKYGVHVIDKECVCRPEDESKLDTFSFQCEVIF